MVYKSNSFRAFQQSQPRKKQWLSSGALLLLQSQHECSTHQHIQLFWLFWNKVLCRESDQVGVVCHVCLCWVNFPHFSISFETGTLVRYILFHHHDQCNNLLICCGVEHHVLDCINSFKFRDTFILPSFFDVDVWSGSHAAAEAFFRVQRALRLTEWRFPSNSLCGMKPTSTMMFCRR